MATQKEKQAFLRHYKAVTGAKELDMHEVAKMAKLSVKSGGSVAKFDFGVKSKNWVSGIQ